jgi:hypothetical protein
MCSEAINESKRPKGSIVRVKASCKYLPGKIGLQNLLLYFAYINILLSEKDLQISLAFVGNVVSKIEQFHVLGNC